MNRDAINAIPVLLLTSPIDWPIHLITDSWLPKWPSDADLDRGEPGNWHHSGKDWWSVAFRSDAQYWQKLVRFGLWWGVVLLIVS
jgi:hypothetical protein